MKTLMMSTAMIAVAGAAQAASLSIDFETGYSGDVTELSFGEAIVGFPGVTVSSTDTPIQVVKTGNPRDGFVPDDMPENESFGNFFLTGDFIEDTNLTLMFATDIVGLSFDIADIDGGGPNNLQNVEMFTFIASLNDVPVETIMVDALDDNAGNAVITKIAFGDDIRLDKLSITGITTKEEGNKRNIGWGIDNIHATEVPLPAAGWLLIGAFGGLAAMKRRRKA